MAAALKCNHMGFGHLWRKRFNPFTHIAAAMRTTIPKCHKACAYGKDNRASQQPAKKQPGISGSSPGQPAQENPQTSQIDHHITPAVSADKYIDRAGRKNSFGCRRRKIGDQLSATRAAAGKHHGQDVVNPVKTFRTTRVPAPVLRNLQNNQQNKQNYHQNQSGNSTNQSAGLCKVKKESSRNSHCSSNTGQNQKIAKTPASPQQLLL